MLAFILLDFVKILIVASVQSLTLLLPSVAAFDIVRLFAPETWMRFSPPFRARQAEWEKVGCLRRGKRVSHPRRGVEATI